MKTFLLIAQLVVSGLLILTILSQEKGAGLSATFGGTGQLYSGRRGVDRLLLWLTIILAVIFVGISIAFLFVTPKANTGVTGTAAATSVPADSFKVKAEGENTSGLKVTPVAPGEATPSQ